MSLTTAWGYSMPETNSLPDFITSAEFNAYTANKFSGDARVASAISAASHGIRDYCGWHLYPSALCEFKSVCIDKRISKTRYGILVELPARYVTAISKVEINGTEFTNFSCETSGILRVFDVNFSEFAQITIRYTAGLPDGLMLTIKDIASSRAVKPMCQSYGITTEAAGGVSITYNSNWANDNSASLIKSAEASALDPYCLRGVF